MSRYNGIVMLWRDRATGARPPSTQFLNKPFQSRKGVQYRRCSRCICFWNEFELCVDSENLCWMVVLSFQSGTLSSSEIRVVAGTKLKIVLKNTL
jgi:hypothetical protein